MIERREILDIASTLGLSPQVVEKDYVLGWVLAGIYQHAGRFGEMLVGGLGAE